MLSAGPANNQYVELWGTAYGEVTGLNGMNRDPRTVAVSLDLRPMECSLKGASGVLLFGNNTAGWYLTYDDPGAGAGLGINTVSFITTRNSVAKIATCSANYNERQTFFGMDDASTVELADDGAFGTRQTWTVAQGGYPLAAAASPIELGKDGTTFTHLRFYEGWVRMNGLLVAHWRPKLAYQGATGDTTATIPDLSGMGNDLVVHGVQGTSFAFGEAWFREPAFAGTEALG